MRIFLACLAAAGAVVAVLGVVFSLSTLVLVGVAAIIVAAVMGALAAPRAGRGR